MLNVVIPARELFDERTQEFIASKQYELRLEHSLVSLSKWESRWCKPFLTQGDKTTEETIDYIRCMTITQNVDPIAYKLIPKNVMDQITDYIGSPMTATKISNVDKTTSKEIITAEIVYYWMISFNIPFECQTWHLNRLLTLINVCSLKNQKPKKMSRKEAVAKQRALNEARKSKFNTPG